MKHDNRPLSRKELREMHNEVVVVKTLEYGEESKGILDFSDPNDSDNGVYVGCSFYSIEHYGVLWLAYAYLPIDFDKWEPCPDCKEPSCNTCAYSASSKERLPCSECCPYTCYDPFPFCPECGRPLTNEARKMLENRLRGK